MIVITAVERDGVCKYGCMELSIIMTSIPLDFYARAVGESWLLSNSFHIPLLDLNL